VRTLVVLACCLPVTLPAEEIPGSGEVQGELPPCPVMPENQSVVDYFVDYEGLRYFFCCEGCVNDFQSDPSRFVSLGYVKGFPISEFQDAGTGERIKRYEPEGVEWAIDQVFEFLRWKDRTWVALHLDTVLVKTHFLVALSIVCLPFLVFLVRRLRRRKTASAGPVDVGAQTSSLRWWKRFAWLAIVLAVLDGCYLAYLANHRMIANEKNNRELESLKRTTEEESLKTEIHYSTFINYGFPPRPEARKRANALSAVYYRGNDERLEAMFNGGQYLTVTFHLQLETEDGTPIQYGQSLEGKSPYLKVRFERAADTSSGYYQSEYMQRMYLTMIADPFLGRDEPVADRQPWIETVEGSVWEARFPIPPGDQFPREWKERETAPFAENSYRGVVYLCEERKEKNKVQGGRYHYGVEYLLRIEDGKVTPDSNLFMGSTYNGTNFVKYRITDDQWLSLEPIPEKPLPESAQE
jgi:YHS domain-containing protein